ncbi:MAG: ABC transporter permease [Nanoarchaeota archaeon]|nr:ABC transporter permease [Nanoarchaeota archaeon]
MRKLYALIKKNLKLIVRSKSSAVMIVLGPLLLIILIGAAFNTASIYGIRVGVYSESYSTLSEAIIYELNQNNYLTQKVGSEQSCVEGIKNGVFHVCAIFPKNLQVSQGGQITFYVDNTKTNIVYLITETILAQISKKSQDLSFQLTKGITDTLEDIESEINDKQALVEEIKSINEQKEVTANSIGTGLEEMKLDHTISEIPLGSLEPEVTDGGKNAFKAVENKIEIILKDTSTADNKKNSLLKKVKDLSQDIESTKLSISQLQLTFNKIKKDISNVKKTGVNEIVNPIESEIKPITTEKTHLNFIFPTLLVMIIMFVSMLLTSTVEIREKTSKVYFKNFITPTSEAIFTFSNYATNIIIIALQTTILLGAASYFFYDNIAVSIKTLLIALFLMISIFLFIGIILGSIFKTEETNTITVISLGFIMIFFSSAILPIETLPSVIKGIASFNPFYISELALNQIILFQAPLKSVSNHLIRLAAYLVGAIILTAIVKRVAKRRQ